MAARLALLAAVVWLAAVLGWTSAAPEPPSVVRAHPLRTATLLLDAPGGAAAVAAAELARGGGATLLATAAPTNGARPAAVLASAPPPPRPRPPPPPPSPEQVLRGAVTAVARDEGGLRLVVAGPGGGRRLGVGDAFMGWRVASITREGAVIAKGAARREVSFFTPPPAGAAGGVVAGTAAPLPSIPGPSRPAPLQRAPSVAEFMAGFKG